MSDVTTNNMKFTVVADKDRMEFLPELGNGNVNLGLAVENWIYTKMDELSQGKYSGGMWDFIRTENGGMAMVFGDVTDEKYVVPPQQNFFEGEINPWTLSYALNMWASSSLFFQLQEKNEAAARKFGNNYHLLREAIADEEGESLIPDCVELFGLLD